MAGSLASAVGSSLASHSSKARGWLPVPEPGPATPVCGVLRLLACAAPTARCGLEAYASGHAPGDDAPGPHRAAMARVAAERQDHRVSHGDAALYLDRDRAMPVLAHSAPDPHP